MEITIDIKGHTNERADLFTAYLHVYGDDVLNLPLQEWVLKSLRRILAQTHEAEQKGIDKRAACPPEL